MIGAYMNENFTSNVAFAGLTAAGKTTHAKRLAEELSYDYVSATDVLLEILGIDEPSDQVWFTRLQEIQAARGDDAVDTELEERLAAMNQSRQRTVFDTWALAWIGRDPLIRIWIESDVKSRVRKCIVSQHSSQLDHKECRDLIREKDEFNRRMFHRRHGFDLFSDRSRYDAVLCNSHLIPVATTEVANSGIESFAPVVYSAVICIMTADKSTARTLQKFRPKEVKRITVTGNARAHIDLN